MIKRFKLLVYLSLIAFSISFAENKTMLVHHKGGIDVYLYSEIDSIVYSTASENFNGDIVQEIWSAGIATNYLLSEIDSVTFQTPPTIAKSSAIDLAKKHSPFLIKADYENDNCLYLKKNTPDELIPVIGNILYLEKPTETMQYGFVGKVKSIVSDASYISVKCEHIDLDEVFDQLVWTSSEGIAFAPTPENNETLPWITSDLDYPNLIEGALILTDDLKDIPIGPEKAKIDANVGFQPFITCQVGAYILHKGDELAVNKRVLRTKINTNVKISADGRQICEEKQTIGKENKYVFSHPIGFGQGITGTFIGTLTIEGTMGLEYESQKGYEAEMTTMIKYLGNESAIIETKGKQTTKSNNEESLSASFDGNLSVTGALSLSYSQTGYTEKSLTNNFSYGSSLKGNALLKSSELSSANNDTSLYEKLTRTGIEARPIEKLSATAKFQGKTLKDSISSENKDCKTYYLVPKLSNPEYDDASGQLSFAIEGEPMKISKSMLGITLISNGKPATHFSSDKIWPENATFDFSTKYDESEYGIGILQPTVTLPDGTQLLASPKCDIRFVDLGLNVLWAKCNVGSNLPQGFGDYYAWGETTTKADYDYEDWKESDIAIDSNGNLTPTFDAAHIVWGDECRMPTNIELKELVSKCTFSHTTIDGINGLTLKGPNGKSIFLPFAGQIVGERPSGVNYECGYPSSTIYGTLDDKKYYYLYIVYDDYFFETEGSPIVHNVNPTSLYYGQPIRAVKNR